MNEAFNRVIDILRSDKCTLRELAEVAGADPTVFYRGCSLEGVDLRGQDLREISLTGANLMGVIVDHRTQFPDAIKSEQPMAINYMQVSYEAIKGIGSVDLVTDLLHWLATSAGLDVKRSDRIKESSPVNRLKDQIHIRIKRCIGEIRTYREVRTGTKLAVYRDRKVLLDMWETVAFLNFLAERSFVFADESIGAYREWRYQVMREPVSRSLTVYAGDNSMLYDDNYNDVDLYLHLEPLLMAVHLVERRKIEIKDLDRVLRAYHRQLYNYFPGEVEAPEVTKSARF